MAFVAKWGAGKVSPLDPLPVVVAWGIVFAGSMLGMAKAQRAFQFGEASKPVPIQKGFWITPLEIGLVTSPSSPRRMARPARLAGLPTNQHGVASQINPGTISQFYPS